MSSHRTVKKVVVVLFRSGETKREPLIFVIKVGLRVQISLPLFILGYI